jgi:2-methylisocitrate lyase-like PEP mutase family enzyme
MTTQADKAQELRRLHGDPALLVLVNVWDAVSARTVASAPGCRALATASWSIAAAHGVADHENLSREEMLAAIARIAGAVELPVTADLEEGYGADAAAVGETIAGAIEAGAVGCNLEDAMRDPDEHAARVAAAREAGERAGVPIVINARTDEFLTGGRDVDVALDRGRRYLEAGADTIFVPGAWRPDDLRALVAGMGGPVSIIAGAGGPSLAELQEIGIVRASLGPGSMGAAMAALRGLAESLLGGGELPEALGFRP